MQSGATASGPGSKHPEQEQLFDVFEVREWGGNSLEKVELKINIKVLWLEIVSNNETPLPVNGQYMYKDITLLLLKMLELTPVDYYLDDIVQIIPKH